MAARRVIQGISFMFLNTAGTFLHDRRDVMFVVAAMHVILDSELHTEVTGLQDSRN